MKGRLKTVLNLDTKNKSTDLALSCMICESSEFELMHKAVRDFEYNTYKPVNYLICKGCKLILQNPLPGKNILSDFYPDEYRNYLPAGEDLFSSLKKLQFQNLADKVSKHFNKDSKILEVGFGNGQLLLTLKQSGYGYLYGSDFTDRMFSSLREKGIKLSCTDIEESFPFNDLFDVIILNNVIEHFLQPMQVLKKCKNNLTRSGKIILITPNSSAVEFKIFKKYWAGYHAPRHTFLFNSENIKLVSKKLGFSNIIIEETTDPGQWAISVQNVLQDFTLTKTKLKNGMAWYTLPLSMVFSPVAMLQNLTGRSTSMMCVLKN